MAEVIGRQRVHRNQDLWDKVWRDKHGNIVVYQRPNVLLIVWVVLTLASLFVPTGTPESVVWWASLAVLALWAVLEVWKGVNYFRKALGVIVLLLILLAAFKLA